jgi:5'-AMP-activated protein kinase beta subunit, interaction domain
LTSAVDESAVIDENGRGDPNKSIEATEAENGEKVSVTMSKRNQPSPQEGGSPSSTRSSGGGGEALESTEPEASLRPDGPPDAIGPPYQSFDRLATAKESAPRQPRQSPTQTLEDGATWTTKIPHDVFLYTSEEDEDSKISSSIDSSGPLMPPHPPPQLPAQLRKAVLNEAVLVPEGSGDDNSIIPLPEHSVIDHLLASPINKGYFSVAVTERYKQKVRLDWQVT